MEFFMTHLRLPPRIFVVLCMAVLAAPSYGDPNRTRGKAVYPTPVIGSVGLVDDINLALKPGFKQAGDLVLLLGSGTMDRDPQDLAASLALEELHSTSGRMLSIDLDLETRLQHTCLALIREGMVESPH